MRRLLPSVFRLLTSVGASTYFSSDFFTHTLFKKIRHYGVSQNPAYSLLWPEITSISIALLLKLVVLTL